MKQISILKNPVQTYVWGSRTAIQSLLNWPRPWSEPVAELWLGAHPKAPSQVHINGEWKSLTDVIAATPESVLGKAASKRFSNRLPFLLKVLAADRPLSIQVHPHRTRAREGFERENRLNIPLDAPHRNYKDPSHKPELLCAVTPFEVLKGFRAPKEVLMLMEQVFASPPEELELLRKETNRAGLKKFFTALLYMTPERRLEIIQRAVTGAKAVLNQDRAFHWLLKLNREYPGDMGILSPLLLNLATLSPGEAFHVPAGELHSYLSGVGMEIMASSDNVLRCGLTPKHVDIPELLEIVNFDATPLQKQQPMADENCERIYKTPAKEFQLSEIVLNGERAYKSRTERSVEILICMEGNGMIKASRGSDPVPLSKGVSVIVPSDVPEYVVSGNITLYKGTSSSL